MRGALQLSEPALLHVVFAVPVHTGHRLLCFVFVFLCCRRNGRLASVALREADP